MSYNTLDLMVVQCLSSVHTMLVQQWCTALVWATSFVFYYEWDTESAVGEAWTPYGFLQLAGFAVFAFGQFVYSELITLSGFTCAATGPASFEHLRGAVVHSHRKWRMFVVWIR